MSEDRNEYGDAGILLQCAMDLLTQEEYQELETAIMLGDDLEIPYHDVVRKAAGPKIDMPPIVIPDLEVGGPAG